MLKENIFCKDMINNEAVMLEVFFPAFFLLFSITFTIILWAAFIKTGALVLTAGIYDTFTKKNGFKENGKHLLFGCLVLACILCFNFFVQRHLLVNFYELNKYDIQCFTRKLWDLTGLLSLICFIFSVIKIIKNNNSKSFLSDYKYRWFLFFPLLVKREKFYSKFINIPSIVILFFLLVAGVYFAPLLRPDGFFEKEECSAEIIKKEKTEFAFDPLQTEEDVNLQIFSFFLQRSYVSSTQNFFGVRFYNLPFRKTVFQKKEECSNKDFDYQTVIRQGNKPPKEISLDKLPKMHPVWPVLKTLFENNAPRLTAKNLSVSLPVAYIKYPDGRFKTICLKEKKVSEKKNDLAKLAELLSMNGSGKAADSRSSNDNPAQEVTIAVFSKEELDRHIDAAVKEIEKKELDRPKNIPRIFDGIKNNILPQT